ncbi:hypothetical protein PS627_01673 [Pseudomonas fluorescens]|uniref:hypothetical protein n=1 Tax=Pseudomonas fluorescens TaxID=294 RepID=UPI001254AC2C|nr:hypothetical protein [Pseudomonas fluorescens]CAG8865754.1 hypothetical protein PS627_01673 [Pseudomonas fluorescens]VVP88094.1 hypothetical protein PS910_02616 [Pseudomonas fluorescens]
MAKARKQPGSGRTPDMDRLMLHALAGFEVDSRMACRALRVSLAMQGFGVGTLLDNDLPRGEPVPARAEPMDIHAAQ